MKSGKQEPVPEDLVDPGQQFGFGLKCVASLISSQQFGEVGVICPFYTCGNRLSGYLTRY